MILRTLVTLTSLLVNARFGSCICYFPGELQGIWATQKTTATPLGSRGARSPISYQEIAIEADMILQWGMCHAREDNNVILMDNTGSTRCYRCVYLNVASPKVVQVWTMSLQMCYTSEEAARSNCPTSQAMASRRAKEIMLYKIRSAWGEPEVTELECPLNGRFTFTYRRGLNGANTALCDQPTSEFSNCPYGFGFSVHYRDCSFVTPLRTGLQCLGSWTGEDGEEYLAVMDTSVKEGDDSPRFKCGMFHEEAGTGRVFLAFSEDSTCSNSLTSPKNGFETYELRSVPPLPLPPSVGQATCNFPRSLSGHWHHTYVGDDTVVFKDYRNFKTYSARCVRDLDDGERYIVYARTHCGDWSYNCLWLKRRSANVLEFMMGLYPRETFDDRLCDDVNFGDKTSWVTQGKSLLEEPTTCPIVGNYMGALPDANGICAQLYSNCEDPQIMFYTVSECSNLSAVYEREDLPGPTSEAGPWLPPEQKVSTGAMLTIIEDARPQRRGRRQAGNGRLRVANARTTTISWLWGSSSTQEVTTTPSTTTTIVPRNPAFSDESDWRHPQPPPVSNGRGNERRVNGDSFLEDRNPMSDRHRPELPLSHRDRPEPPSPDRNRPQPPLPDRNRPQPPLPDRNRPQPPRQSNYDAVGFWPGSNNQPEYTVNRDSTPPPPPPPPAIVPGPIRDVLPDESNLGGGGVPGRATWVPGAPPGFQSPSSSASSPAINENNPSLNSQRHVSSSFQSTSSKNSDNLPHFPSSGDNRQPLKQGMHERHDAFAWDNRHKYPKGHWLTLDTKRYEGSPASMFTESSIGFDRSDSGRDWGNSRDSKFGMTDDRKLHENERNKNFPHPSSPLPIANDDHSTQNSFYSDSAHSSFKDPLNQITASPFTSLKPLNVSHRPQPPSHVTSLHSEHESTNHRHHGGVGYTVKSSNDKVRDENAGFSGHRPLDSKRPSGRGYWDSSRGNRKDDSQVASQNGHSHFQDAQKHTTPSSTSDRDSGAGLDKPSNTYGNPHLFLLHDDDDDDDRNRFENTYTNEVSDRPLDLKPVSNDSRHRHGNTPSSHRGDPSSNEDLFGRGKVGRDSVNIKPRQEVNNERTGFSGGFPVPKRNGQPQKQEREYQCLGQWEEEGRVYALTYRRDIRTYECFVGVIKTNGVVFIKEAGAVCSRGVHPEVLGMKLHRKGETCPQSTSTSQAISQTSSRPTSHRDNRFRATQPPWLRTTRPWKPITGRPRHRGSGSASLVKSSQSLLFVVLVSLYYFQNYV